MWFWITCVAVVLIVVLFAKAVGRRPHGRYRAQHAGGIGRGEGGGAGDGGGDWGWGWGDGGGDGDGG